MNLLNKWWKREPAGGRIDPREIPALTLAIEKEPEEYSHYWRRAHAYDGQKKYAQAIADYARVIALNPGFVGAQINRAACYTDLHQYERAILDLDRVISIHPRLANAYHNRAINEYHLGKIEAAFGDLDQALTLDPKNARYFLSRAQIRFETRAGSVRQALADVNRAIRLDPRAGLAHYYRGLIFQTLGECAPAVADLLAAIRLGLPEEMEQEASRMLNGESWI